MSVLKWQRVVAVLGLLAVAIAVAACGSGDDKNGSGTTTAASAELPAYDAAKARDVSFAMGDFLAPALIIASEADGDLSGVNVKLVNQDSGAAALPLIAHGDLAGIADVGIVPVVTALARGIPLRVVWVNGTPPDELWVNRDITSAADLKGKKIAAPGGATPQLLLMGYLKKNGMSLDDIDFVDMPPPSMAAAFRSGQIDGAYIWPPVTSQLQAAGAVRLDASPDIGLTAFSGDFVDAHPDAVQGVVCALATTHRRFHESPEGVWRTVADKIGAPVDEVSAQLSTENVPPADQATPDYLGTADQPSAFAASVYEAGTALAELGAIPSAPSRDQVHALFDARFAQRAADGSCG